ncbi:M56 family metallopeptidase [Desulfitobacterium chlororespirans]|uniref:Signal transducer regulating beta-lactamase production, contains metallopeptidase domain n=1 Tax=Desulfitobacterium chlororespirans DSM 11544 TaxID=1121395 RepID=A0A1M7SDJ9_9FIRM|nr:Signal transducer regulating beta-lactamase production, contains metallopeptidase domain [Desulfitobacterium chlororespirans DSM 11544]
MEGLFLTVLNMSLTGSYVIAAIMLARLFLKKAPKAVSYALWGTAGFRLIFPFSFESVFSLIPFKAQLIPQTAPLGENVSLGSAVGAALRAVGDAANGGLGTVTVYLGQTADGYSITTQAYHSEVWLMFGSYLWLIGMAALLLYSAVSIVLLKRRLHGAVLSVGNIYESDKLRTPFVLGVFRPKIYVPIGLREEERRYILLHEQTHIQRFDHLVKPFAFLILSLHWFNPLVWMAFSLMSTDMELSCDEKVLKAMGQEMKKPYAQSLLSLAAGRRFLNGSPLAFGEGNVKARIKNVLNYKKPANWVIMVATVFVVALSIGLAANKANSATGDYDFSNFSINGFMLGADTKEMDTSAFTPIEPLQIKNGYDFNFEEARYSVDENTRRLIKLFVNVYDGADIPAVTLHKGEGATYIPDKLKTIEQVVEVFGQGKRGWQDREQGLRYLEYRQKEGRLSATVRFVYTDGYSDGINHHLVWVMAESSLPYPYPTKAQTDEPLIFSSGETDLIKLGQAAFETYMVLRMSEKTPVEERIASYQLNDISIVAGDIHEFCVAVNYDFTTDHDGYRNPAEAAKGKGTWPDNYRELRVQYAYEDIYAIISIGTGGGGQGLPPYPAE